MAKKRYWLMKSEPGSYSIDDLKRDRKSLWDGVRNYQARNFMINDMSVGDQVVFYHSNATPPGAAGVAEVCAQAEPDPTAQDPGSKYYDPKASPEKPIWQCVTVRFRSKFPRLVPLAEMRDNGKLKDMMLLRKGMRLSIQPLTAQEFNSICKMAEK